MGREWALIHALKKKRRRMRDNEREEEEGQGKRCRGGREDKGKVRGVSSKDGDVPS